MPQRQQRTALITGATRRIGAAIATRLAAAGFDLALHSSARSRVETESLAHMLRASGRRVSCFAADLRNPDEIAHMIAHATKLENLCALVNNASLFEEDHPAHFTTQAFDAHIAANLRAPLLLAQKFYAHAKTAPGASIVNIVDQRALRPSPQFFTYAVSKAGLWSATQMMAQAFAPHVRVNAVGPGPVLPNQHEGEQGFAQEVAQTLLGRAVDPAEIAEAVLYLLEAHSVTGQMIAVDSGQHLSF
jgi:NAD(P)-dependent dehydrogenase (short-subunit alcohol dehydrogenase family)